MKDRLDSATSVYLNAVRFLAALIVFFGHISGHRFTGGFLWPLAKLMDFAVMVFFVLSGFVIAYVTDDHEPDLRTYAINRIARIYSVALPALIIGFILDSIGRHWRVDLYAPGWGFSDKRIWLQYLTAVTFTHRLWWNEINPGSVLPYWSLGNEVWYYIIFAITFYMRGWMRYVLGPLSCAAAGPVILSLFPVWLLGFAIYHIGNRCQLPKWLAQTILLLSAAALAVMLYLVVHYALDIPPTVPIRYAAGIAFALNVMAFRSLAKSLRWITRFDRPVNWLSGMTFSLYLFHLPVAQFLTTIVPWPPTSVLTRLVMFGGTFMIVAVLAELTERRKKAWRNSVSILFSRILPLHEPEPIKGVA